MGIRARSLWVAACAIVLCWGGVSRGQTLIQGGTARENMRTAGERSPGNMVGAGLARAQSAVVVPTGGGVDISETQREQDLRASILAPVLETFFKQFDTFLTLVTNLLLERAGFNPLPTTSGTTGGGSATSGDTTSGDTATTGDTGRTGRNPRGR